MYGTSSTDENCSRRSLRAANIHDTVGVAEKQSTRIECPSAASGAVPRSQVSASGVMLSVPTAFPR